jgi:hypothetical protein
VLNRKTLIIIATSLTVIALLGYAIMTYVVRKDNLHIAVAPRSATVKIDDKQVEANKSIYVSPGDHTLSITADNFNPINEKIIATDAYKSLAYCLIPNNEHAENYKKNVDEAYICEAEAGQQYLKDSQAAIEKYPVIAKLPYEDGTFSIGQGVTEKNEVAIYVHYSSDKPKREALDWIHRYQKDNLPPVIYTNDYEQTDRIGGMDSPLDKILVAKYPIVKDLPIDGSFFRIGYRLDPSDQSGESIKLTVTADSPMGRMAAFHEIQARSYNPTDFKIEFINFESEVSL